LKNNHKILKKL